MLEKATLIKDSMRWLLIYANKGCTNYIIFVFCASCIKDLGHQMLKSSSFIFLSLKKKLIDEKSTRKTSNSLKKASFDSCKLISSNY